jgi:hypothetical protein
MSPFPEVPCVLCHGPVDLQNDLCADENGQAVHAECYFSHISPRLNSRETRMTDSAQ